jgi:hypothetical protein
MVMRTILCPGIRPRPTCGETGLTKTDQIPQIIPGHTSNIIFPLIMPLQPVGRFQVLHSDVPQKDPQLERAFPARPLGRGLEVFQAAAEVDLAAGRADFEHAECGRGTFEEMAEGGDEVEV